MEAINIKQIERRIMLSRMRILCNNGFYGLLLMHMKISLGNKHETAWTDCRERIWFNPEFVNKLNDGELDFVFMHEIVHVVLQHSLRIGSRDSELYNIASDIVVNSNILQSNNGNVSTITLKDYGESMHIAPDGTEGYLHTVDEVYKMLLVSTANDRQGWDVHEFGNPSEEELEDNRLKWEAYFRNAYEAMENRAKCNMNGNIPAFAIRMMNELKTPQIDWRQILVEFIQEEINDYSFMPPDRRMSDSPFFLPDFNETTERIEKILFMVDTSGSMSDDNITVGFSEIKGAIDQFDGRMEGHIGFFDAAVIEPVPFESVDDVLSTKAIGGGGTSFSAIFDYINEKMTDDPPVCVIILTDGYAKFPDESVTNDIPVLWIINNEEITPPWGVVARIK